MSTAAPLRFAPVLACYLYRAVVGLLVALPMAMLVASVVGGHPRSDAVLFDDGGLWLVETTRLLRDTFPPLLGHGGLIILLGAFGWLLPLGALIASLDPDRPPWRASMQRAGQHFGRLSLLMGGTLVARGLTLAFMVAVALIVRGDGHVRQTIAVAVGASTLVLWWLLDLLHDAMRVVCIRADASLGRTILSGAKLLLRRRRQAVVAASWRTAAALAAFSAAAVLGSHLVGGAGSQLLALIVVHQLALAVHVVARASWLRWLVGAMIRDAEAVSASDPGCRASDQTAEALSSG